MFTSSSRNPLGRRIIAGFVTACLALQAPLTAWGANNPLSRLTDVNTIDLVANVDWDFDNPPDQVDQPGTKVDKAFITEVLRTAAQSMYTFTEGKHRVGTVFIYKNKFFGTNVDIQIINKDGRSNAHGAGWGNAGLTSHNYLSLGKPETASDVGKVVAHEMGHYIYALYDEYVEAGRKVDPKNPHMPAEVDTPKDTIMHNHLQFLSLSTPADYLDPATRNTAQARVYGKADGSGGSHWELLTRADTKQDGAFALQYFRRTVWEAFKGIDPAKIELKRPVAGYDAVFQPLFISDPVLRDVIVVDRTLPADRLADLAQAAIAMVNKAEPNTFYTVLTSPPLTGTNTMVLSATQANAAGKTAIAAAINNLATTGAGAAGTFDTLGVFTSAFNAISSARKAGDPASIHLMSGVELVVPEESVTASRVARVGVNAVAMTIANGAQTGYALRESPKGMVDRLTARAMRTVEALKASASGKVVSLAELALRTGGKAQVAKDGAQAAKGANANAKASSGKSVSAIAFAESDKPLAASQLMRADFTLASGPLDGDVEIEAFFDPADAAKLEFSLTTPNGQNITSANPPAGVTFELDAEEGFAGFSIAANSSLRNASGAWVGKWSVGVRAKSATKETVGIEVNGLSPLGLAVDVLNGQADSVALPVISAVLKAEYQVTGAVVQADIYDESDNLVLGGLSFTGDPQGQYSLSLDKRLKPGEYIAVITAKNTGAGRQAEVGANVKGKLNVAAPVEQFDRLASVAFEVQAGAPGVLAAVSVPIVTPTVPVITPTVPSVTPTVPTVTPTVPVVTPTVPRVTPTVPAVTPTVPVVTPTVPMVTPTTPVVTPTTPVVTPTTPVVTPTTPTTGTPTGVTPLPPPAAAVDSGGGCTVATGNGPADAGLLLMLSLAFALAMYRRRASQQVLRLSKTVAR